MNIIIISSAGMASGGARQAVYQARAFMAAGHRVHFVSYPDPELRALGPDINWVDFPRGKIKALPAIEKVLRGLMPPPGSKQPCVVQSYHNWAGKVIAYLGTKWRIQGLPVVCAAHRGVTNKPGNPLPYLLPGIRAFMGNSRQAIEQMPLFWRRKRALVLGNAIPPERLRPGRSAAEVLAELKLPSDPDHFIFGDVGQDKPAKGVERLLRAYAKIVAQLPPSSLVVVGVSPKRWLPLCLELDIADQVRLVPRNEKVADYLQIFSLFVFPSYFIESQPNVIMEAMSLGKPVTGSNIGEVAGMIGKDFTFTPGDVDEMAAQMLRLARAPQLLAQAAAANREASRAFALETRMQRLIEVYKKILAEARLDWS